MESKDKMLITGGNPLVGEITVSGGKNTAVAVIPAALLCNEPCTIENLPDIEDVRALVDILRELGAEVDYRPGQRMVVNAANVKEYHVPYRQTRRLRASYYLLGALLGRGGRAEVAYPGGCNIGSRPIDQHLKGFETLGAAIEDRGGVVYARADHLVGNDVFFDMVTVGGTINVLLAAARAEGTTVIYNAAKEPHIVDLANFLNSMGAKIRGAGTAYRVSGAKKAFALPEDKIVPVIEKQNRHRGVFVPTDRKAYYETIDVSGFPCLIVREKPQPAKRAILYFFGGGMVIGPDKGDLPVMRKLGRDTGCDVWFPFYPLCTEHCITTSYAMVYECYRRMIDLYGGGNVSTCGFSSGGALALGIAAHNNALGAPLPPPRHIVAVSPGEVPWNDAEKARMQALNDKDVSIDYAHHDEIPQTHDQNQTEEVGQVFQIPRRDHRRAVFHREG